MAKDKRPKQQHISTADAATQLGLTEETIRRKCRSGELKAVHLGHWRVNVDQPEKSLRLSAPEDS